MIEFEDAVGKKLAEKARSKELNDRLDKAQEDVVECIAELAALAHEAAKNRDLLDVRDCLELIQLIQDMYE